MENEKILYRLWNGQVTVAESWETISTAKSVLGWMQKLATLSLPTILHTFRKIWYNEGIKSKEVQNDSSMDCIGV